jgi:hypothetical protein
MPFVADDKATAGRFVADTPAPDTAPAAREQLRTIAAPSVRALSDIAGFPGDVAYGLQNYGTKLTQAYDRARGADPVPDAPSAAQSPMTGEWIKQKLANTGALPTPEGQNGLERGLETVGSIGLAAPRGLLNMAREVPALAREGGEAIAGMPGVRQLLGREVAPAQQTATAAARKGLDSAAGVEESNAQWNQLHQQRLEQTRSTVDQQIAQLSKLPPGVKDLDAQGALIRNSFNGAIESAKSARNAEADVLFAQARDAAQAKEAAGARIDITSIEKDLMELRKQAAGIKPIETQIDSMLGAVRGAPAEKSGVQAPQLVDMRGNPIPRPPQPSAPSGKTFAQLELARRYLNDVAYAGEAEGFPAIVRNQAKSTAKSIDQAMQSFVPEFGAYKDRYRVMSEPLESLNTRLGKLVSSTEGGLQEGAYAKTAAADLPAKLFGRKEGVELLTDALAGGKNASPQARAQAAAQVDQMVEGWLLKTLNGEKPQAALSKLRAPGTEAALTAAPAVAGRLEQRYGQLSQLGEQSADLAKRIEGLGKSVVDSQKIAGSMRKQAEMADRLVTADSVMLKTEGYNAYRNLLRTARKNELLSDDQYGAIQALFDRAATLQEKTDLARRLATFMGLSVGGAELVKHYF